MIKKFIPFYFVGLLLTACGQNVEPPQARTQIPSEHQLEWQKLEYYMFVHFGPNTFTDMEWGHGTEDPKVFNPTALDCSQWASTAKAAGMKGIIITAKHHDGFCLWPSKYSTHTVRESSWKEGQGDVLRELSEACREYELKFGVYLSPWDRNHPDYGTPEYNEVFVKMLGEVLGDYGEVFEQWFDGANGEGPNGKKQVYDWEKFNETVRTLQPQAVIFSDVGPGCRWIGNERGSAGETNWSMLNTDGFAPGADAPKAKVLNEGEIDGAKWLPGEADVSIRPGWFYSESTDDKVKSLQELIKIYHNSVGRNANLLLNVPPDRRGLIHPADSIRLVEFGKWIKESFANNLLAGAEASADKVRGKKNGLFDVKYTIDANFDTYWTTNDEQTSASLQFDLKEDKSFDCIVIQEYIPLGQRVKAFSVEYLDGDKWTLIDRQTTIGYKRILHFPTITARKIRINIEEALPCPTIAEIGLYN
ncbi:MAG: alpha-L-fucosidase [Prevotellaceae bacterium]|jgi:alpha-L-fucosidase|nr:alpha-L-fucosidase [Prevotellaceae bacterium]